MFVNLDKKINIINIAAAASQSRCSMMSRCRCSHLSFHISGAYISVAICEKYRGQPLPKPNLEPPIDLPNETVFKETNWIFLTLKPRCSTAWAWTQRAPWQRQEFSLAHLAKTVARQQGRVGGHLVSHVGHLQVLFLIRFKCGKECKKRGGQGDTQVGIKLYFSLVNLIQPLCFPVLYGSWKRIKAVLFTMLERCFSVVT